MSEGKVEQWPLDAAHEYDAQEDDAGYPLPAKCLAEIIAAHAHSPSEAYERGVRDAAKVQCAGCRNGWPTDPGIVVVHTNPNSGEIMVCRSNAILALLQSNPYRS